MTETSTSRRTVGRYVLCEALASGGMATVHLGRLLGTAGFARTVAIKRLHPQYARDPDFVAMFLDEGRLAARIRHPNVIQTLDVVAVNEELFLVLEYVHGESLSRLLAVGLPPIPVATAIMVGALHGLHAAHEATSETGESLGLVHRDVSPQNIFVGAEGVARVLDFGIAKALGRAHTTRDGTLKGKLAYMAPEQLGGKVARGTDVFAASVVMWEALTGKRLFQGADEGEVVSKVLAAPITAPGALRADLPAELNAIVMRGLERDPDNRFASARAMALALERAGSIASASEVGAWVESAARDALATRASLVASVERDRLSDDTPGIAPTEIGDRTLAWPTEEPGSIATSGPNRSVALAARGRWWRGPIPIVALTIGVVLISSQTRSPWRKAGSDASPAAATPTPSSSSPSQPPPPVSSAVEPVVVADPPPAAPAIIPASRRPTNRPAARSLEATIPPSAPSAPAPTNCDPPYRVDDHGVKHWVVLCLHH